MRSKIELLITSIICAVATINCITVADDHVMEEDVELLASDAAYGYQFGYAVAIDGNTAVIGSANDDTNGDEAGSAYVYYFNGSQWIQEDKLMPDEPIEGERFGWSVAISGTRILIGSRYDDVNGEKSGSAYIFEFDGNQWVQGKLIPEAGKANDRFGWSVAIDGDTALVGAVHDVVQDVGAGAAHVFVRIAEGEWIEEAMLVADDGEAGDQFGWSVAISGDRLMVGANEDSIIGASKAGSVYAYDFDGASWVQTDKLLAGDPDTSDQFGSSVSLEGDTALIGARNDNENGIHSGAAYIFKYNGANWEQHTKLIAIDNDDELPDEFGWSGSLSNDTVVIGARRDTDNGNYSGSAYVYWFDGSDWNHIKKLLPSDGASTDQFGFSVSVSGSYALIGSQLHDHDGDDVGSAYIFNVGDVDDDGVIDGIDNCDLYNPDQTDCNENGIGDVCDLADETSSDDNCNGIPDECEEEFNDCNGNGIPDGCELDGNDCNGNGIPDECDIADGPSYDLDDDGIPDECEEDCNLNGWPDHYELEMGWQFDCNQNGILDICDIEDGTSNDVNGNGIPDECEPDCNQNDIPDDWDIKTGTSEDCNANGVPDECELEGNDCNENDIPDDCETDCNGNGVPDDCDIADGTSDDDDGDGIPDECEPDCNKNGVPDHVDIKVGYSEDCNSNGIPDECELPDNDCNDNGIPDDCDIADGTCNDHNGNGIPDICDPDCQPNGYPDFLDIAYGISQDCNGNEIPDECDIADGTELDCNENGIPDDCDLADGTSNDLNGNGIPDECEPDCNGNGIPDFIDIESGTSNDCNENGIPDECDIEYGTSEDCNENGIPDECEIADGTSSDCNGNGIPDECELEDNDCNNNDIPDDCELEDNDCNGNGIPDECDVDCNENGVPDDCDIIGDSEDCNGNGIPDECELVGNDCNDNGIPDECDIADGTSEDCNGNGVPDECVGWWFDCNDNGVPDECDIANGTSEDCNNNGKPDECEIACGWWYLIHGWCSDDNNKNGIPDECDPDCNKNGIPDDLDIEYGTSLDCNENGVPDECDIAKGKKTSDCNGNGIPDECDIESGESLDCDENGVPDECDPDCNENGIPDYCDIFINETSIDYDCDGVPDECQADCNGNGKPDFIDILFGQSEDCNGNDIPDECDINPDWGGTSEDCNGNDIPDECDISDGTSADLDDDGIPDECETDCNLNGWPDHYEIEIGWALDCNDNGILDECDINPDWGGTSEDCNGNDIPDECETDCNGNGVPDECDIADGSSNDVNSNGIPDECEPDCNGNGVPDFLEILKGQVADCNGNDIPDECDIEDGTSTDTNGNGVPDECDVVQWTVDDDGEADFDNIQDAIDAASDGEEILVYPGTYTGTGDNVVNMMGKEIWLHSSEGPEVTVIDGEGVRRGIMCDSGETTDTIIEGFTLSNGNAPIYTDWFSYDYGLGSGLLAKDSSPTITNCSFENNTTYSEVGGFGGAVFCGISDYANSSEINFTNCSFSNNNAQYSGGALYCYYGTYIIDECEFINNTATYGGAMQMEGGINEGIEVGIVEVVNSLISENVADNVGGIRISSGYLTVTDSSVCANSQGQIYGQFSDGGGNTINATCGTEQDVWYVDDDGDADFEYIQQAINIASNGDEIIVRPGVYEVEFSSVANVVNTLGLAINIHSSDGPEVTIIKGDLERRGIICNNGETSDTIIDGFTIRECNAQSYGLSGYTYVLGGGMLIDNCSPTISNCIFEENTTFDFVSNGAFGGGIFIAGYPEDSTTKLTNCVFRDNTALHAGGGVFLWYGNSTLENCTFTENNSAAGAGVTVQNSGAMISNCVIFDNTAVDYGGGMYLVTYSDVLPTLVDSTVCGNAQQFEGQIFGEYIDDGGNTITDMCASNCPADVTGDGVVDVSDLLYIVGFLGTTDALADVNNDSIVDVTDLLTVIAVFGPCT